MTGHVTIGKLVDDLLKAAEGYPVSAGFARGYYVVARSLHDVDFTFEEFLARLELERRAKQGGAR